MAVSELGLLKVPVPLLVQLPLLAPPPTLAAIVAVLPAQMVWSGPACAEASGLMVNKRASDAVPHGPAGSLVVSVRVTVPAVMSATEGV